MTVKHSGSERLKRALDAAHDFNATSFHKRKCSAFGIGFDSTAPRLYVAWACAHWGAYDSKPLPDARRNERAIGFIYLLVSPNLKRE